jgi:hypothetical protein
MVVKLYHKFLMKLTHCIYLNIKEPSITTFNSQEYTICYMLNLIHD